MHSSHTISWPPLVLPAGNIAGIDWRGGRGGEARTLWHVGSLHASGAAELCLKADYSGKSSETMLRVKSCDKHTDVGGDNRCGSNSRNDNSEWQDNCSIHDDSACVHVGYCGKVLHKLTPETFRT